MKKRERIFIVPNGYGFMYGAGIVICILTAATYTNNLIFSLAFFLVGLFLVGMIQTNNNLRGLSVERIHTQVAEEHSLMPMRIYWKNEAAEGHYNLNFRFPERSKKENFPLDSVPARGQAYAEIRMPVAEAGVHDLKKIQVRSVYPFGMFYSWRVYPLALSYYVYPRAAEDFTLAELQETPPLGDASLGRSGQGGEDFSEHRNYQAGESYRQVDWKAFARRQQMLSKHFADGDRHNFFLEPSRWSGDRFTQLRKLVAAILQCEQRSYSYSIYFPSGARLAMGQGERQKERALIQVAKEWADANRSTKPSL